MATTRRIAKAGRLSLARNVRILIYLALRWGHLLYKSLTALTIARMAKGFRMTIAAPNARALFK